MMIMYISYDGYWISVAAEYLSAKIRLSPSGKQDHCDFGTYSFVKMSPGNRLKIFWKFVWLDLWSP